jgi:uncharacterized RDD family membrane protein YckC
MPVKQPEKKPGEYALEYAGFWLRLGSAIIDYAVLFLIILFVYVLFNPNHSISITSIPVIRVVVISIIGFAVIAAYFIAFWAWRGQTLGKMVMGIKIIRSKSNPVDLSHSIQRFGGYILCVLTVFVGFIWIAFDSHKQGLHDKIADTCVVKLPVRQVVLSSSLARGRVG